jgi:type VI protein secretion system component VasK
MLEQALATQAADGQPPVNPQQQAALQTAQIAQNKKSIQDQIKQKQEEIRQLQQQMNNPVMAAESRASLRKRLQESEVQQAQVVLASQDMVDQVQKMLEQVSAMQFKDLPALVDQVKNQVGVDQAMQFNTDASAALTGMIQNLQASKQQLEGALGVVTGQAPVVPGEEMGVPAADDEQVDINAEVPTLDGEEDLDAEMDANLGVPAASLGRGRR